MGSVMAAPNGLGKLDEVILDLGARKVPQARVLGLSAERNARRLASVALGSEAATDDRRGANRRQAKPRESRLRMARSNS